MRFLKAAFVAFLLGLLVAGIPLYWELREAEAALVSAETRLSEEMGALQESLAISNLHSRLGLLLLAIQQQDFDQARQLSTRVFDQANRLAAEAKNPDDRRRLETLRQQRDAITSGLATGDAGTAQTIERLYKLLGESVEPRAQ